MHLIRRTTQASAKKGNSSLFRENEEKDWPRIEGNHRLDLSLDIVIPGN